MFTRALLLFEHIFFQASQDRDLHDASLYRWGGSGGPNGTPRQCATGSQAKCASAYATRANTARCDTPLELDTVGRTEGGFLFGLVPDLRTLWGYLIRGTICPTQGVLTEIYRFYWETFHQPYAYIFILVPSTYWFLTSSNRHPAQT